MTRTHKAEIDLFEAMGLEAGKDWRFHKQGTQVRVEINPDIAGRLMAYLRDNATVYRAVIESAGKVAV